MLGAQALPVKSAEPALVSSTALFFCFGNVENGEADGRVHRDPLRRRPCRRRTSDWQSGADVRLVLVIAGDDFDRLAVDLVAEFLRGHLRGFNRTVA